MMTREVFLDRKCHCDFQGWSAKLIIAGVAESFFSYLAKNVENEAFTHTHVPRFKSFYDSFILILLPTRNDNQITSTDPRNPFPSPSSSCEVKIYFAQWNIMVLVYVHETTFLFSFSLLRVPGEDFFLVLSSNEF